MTHINRKRITSTVDVADQYNSCSVPDNLLTFVTEENNTLGFNMNQHNDGERSFFHGLTMNGHLFSSPLASSSRHHPTSFIKVFLSLSLVVLILCNLFLSANCMPPKIKDPNQQEQVKGDDGLESSGNVSIEVKSKKEPSNCNDDAVRNVCERCVKATKAPSAFRSCCDNTSGTRDYCQQILDYRPSFQTSHESGINSRVAQRKRIFGEHLGKPS